MDLKEAVVAAVVENHYLDLVPNGTGRDSS